MSLTLILLYAVKRKNLIQQCLRIKNPFLLSPVLAGPLKCVYSVETFFKRLICTKVIKFLSILHAGMLKLLESCVKQYKIFSKELSGKDVTNINCYLKHTSAVANSHYVIDSHDIVIHTKTLISKHILKRKEMIFFQLNLFKPANNSQGMQIHSMIIIMLL